MRNLHNNISSILGNVIVRRVSRLIVDVEVLRALGAEFSAALSYYASRLSVEMYGVIWHGPMDLRGLNPHIHAACCFAIVKQRPWGHALTCRHTVA